MTESTAAFHRQIDESRELRDRHDLADLRQRVAAYNDQQGMACQGLRMDPYNPCNGDMGRLCMQCPRKKAVALVTAPIPG